MVTDRGQGAKSGQIICSRQRNHGGIGQVTSPKTKETRATQTIVMLNLKMVRGTWQQVNDCHAHVVLKEQ